MSQGLGAVDATIVIVYLLAILAFGLTYARRVKSTKDLFVAGRMLPFWAIGMSIVVSDIGATDFIAVAGGTYQYGLAQANFDWLGSMPALLVAAFLIIPFYWRSGVYTVPEFLGLRYGAPVQSFLAVSWGLVLTLNLGIMIHATAVLMRVLLGWPDQLSIWVTTVGVGLYTLSGGLAAVVMTDVIQMVIMFLGGGVLVYKALSAVGGWGALREQVLAQGPAYQDHFKLYLPHDTATPFPWTGVILGLGIVLSVAYYTGNQTMVQRALGARSEWDAKGGVLLAGFLKLFIPLLVAVPGLAAIVLAPDLANADDAVPTLIRLLLPPGLLGIMFAAFLAALMSSVDSNLNSATTLWTQDIVLPALRRLGRVVPASRQLALGRAIGVVILLIAAIVAPQIQKQFTNIYTAIQTVFSLIQGPSLAILLLGLLHRRTNLPGALAGLTVGVLTSLLLNSNAAAGLFASDDPFLFVAWWSFAVSLAVTAVVSLATPRPSREQTLGLVLGDLERSPEAQEVLERRVAALRSEEAR